ncbi:MAG: hypothetical protein ACR2Q4_10725 [Geminicoccaceae bacterium]
MTPEQIDLLHALAFLYLRHGQNRRALSLAMLAARRAPDHVGLMRTLAYAFVANGAADEALETIDRLEQRDFAGGCEQMHRLLKARALLKAGRTSEARMVFRQFVDNRHIEAASLADFGQDVDETNVGAKVGEVIDMPAEQPRQAVSVK